MAFLVKMIVDKRMNGCEFLQAMHAATNLNIDDAILLGVAEGAAGLKIERVSYLPSGRVVELTKSLYRGDLYDFVAELQLADNSEKSR